MLDHDDINNLQMSTCARKSLVTNADDDNPHHWPIATIYIGAPGAGYLLPRKRISRTARMSGENSREAASSFSSRTEYSAA